jgi:hypothetical protein
MPRAQRHAMTDSRPIFYDEDVEKDAVVDHAGTTVYALAALAIVALGIVPMFVQYFTYLPLAPDEADIARIVAERDAIELFTKPLGGLIAPPPGFLLLTKLSLFIGGMNEYAVRFPALLGALLALFLLFPAGRRYISAPGALIALAFLATAKYMIVYSSLYRPYALDAGIAVALIFTAGALQRGPIRWLASAFAACMFSASVWFSFPAALVIGGLGTAQLLHAIVKGNGRRFASFALIYGSSGASFCLLYYLIAMPNLQNESQQFYTSSYWTQGGAMPMPPRSIEDMKWFQFHLEKTFEDPCGLRFPQVAAFACVLGALALLYTNRVWFAMLALPIGFTLLASGLHKYPFWERTILFLVPILLLFIGECIASLVSAGRRIPRTAGILLLAMLLFVPAARAIRTVVAPSAHHELHRVLEYAKEHWQEGDLLYLGTVPAQNSFVFMHGRFPFPEASIVWGEKYSGTVPEKLAANPVLLNRLRAAHRVWTPITYDILEVSAPGLTKQFEGQFDLTEAYHARGATVFLFTPKVDSSEDAAH